MGVREDALEAAKSGAQSAVYDKSGETCDPGWEHWTLEALLEVSVPAAIAAYEAKMAEAGLVLVSQAHMQAGVNTAVQFLGDHLKDIDESGSRARQTFGEAAASEGFAAMMQAASQT